MTLNDNVKQKRPGRIEQLLYDPPKRQNQMIFFKMFNQIVKPLGNGRTLNSLKVREVFGCGKWMEL